jgi:hypothetical protein
MLPCEHVIALSLKKNCTENVPILVRVVPLEVVLTKLPMSGQQVLPSLGLLKMPIDIQ